MKIFMATVFFYRWSLSNLTNTTKRVTRSAPNIGGDIPEQLLDARERAKSKCSDSGIVLAASRLRDSGHSEYTSGSTLCEYLVIYLLFIVKNE